MYEQSPIDLVFGVLDADKTVTVRLEHTHSLHERELAHVQVATLYTSVEGERRVRVCNLALQVVSLAAGVFRYADIEAVVTCLLREGIAIVPTTHTGH